MVYFFLMGIDIYIKNALFDEWGSDEFQYAYVTLENPESLRLHLLGTQIMLLIAS